MAIDPTGQDITNFIQEDDGGPVVMLNLMRWKDEEGRLSYLEYANAVARTFLPRVGGEVVYAGSGSTAVIAEAGQDWDAVLLVRYPSRAAFLAMVGDPEYQQITALRTNALEEAVLQATTPWG